MRTYDLIDDAFKALQTGQVEAVINDFPVSKYAEQSKPDLVVVQTIETGEEYGLAFAKESTKLRAEVNKALDEMKEDGTYTRDLQEVVQGGPAGQRLQHDSTRARARAAAAPTEPPRHRTREGACGRPLASCRVHADLHPSHRRLPDGRFLPAVLRPRHHARQLQLRAGRLLADGAARDRLAASWRWSGAWCWRWCAPRPAARCCRCAGSRSPTSTCCAGSRCCS